MVIRSMTATFGCLDNATLKLGEGLNLLELPNESGKSTWCAFIRAMFYGLEARKGGEFSERSRYTPWSGAAMRGEMDILWQDKAITLRRFPKGTNPFGGFQAVYTGTADAVPGLAADNAGEMLLGLTKEVFQRTCFIPQGGLHVEASGDLERRVAALAASGEEDVSYSDAEQRLRQWRNARQANRAVGTLPKLRERLAEVQDQRRRLLDARARGAEAEARLEALEVREREAQDDLARHAALAEAEKAAQRRAQYESTAQRLAQAEEAFARAGEAEAAARAAIPAVPTGPFWLAGALIAALGVILALCGGLIPVAALVPIGIPLAGAGLCLIAIRAKKRARDKALHDEAQALWERAKATLDDAQDEHIAARAAWEAVSAQGEPPAVPAVEDLPRCTLAEDEAALHQARSALALCRDQLSRAQGEEAALGGLAALEGQAAGLEGRIEKEEGELAALNLALDALAGANAALRSRFSPALNQEAGALLARLTGGKYDTLTFTREFEALAQTGAGAKSARLLSQGTADQAYLALRLALCRLALPAGQVPPLVLDDALVTFDDARLAHALDVLSGLAKGRQLLLFTCQSREGARLAISHGNDYNVASIT